MQQDSGMEDISDGEDDLSDFEFDLDDYSPDSFFNDVEVSWASIISKQYQYIVKWPSEEKKENDQHNLCIKSINI